MAIQFYCPYCTAAIRVPDAAAGKKGRCPKCETEVLVPRVKPSEALPHPPSAPARPRTEEDGTPAPPPAVVDARDDAHAGDVTVREKPIPEAKPTLAPMVMLPGPVTPAAIDRLPTTPVLPFDLADPVWAAPLAGSALLAEPENPLATRIQSRRGRRDGRWFVPVVCVAVLTGFCIWLLQRGPSRLNGELPAEVATNFEIPPIVVPPSLIDVDRETRVAVLAALSEKPKRVMSPDVLTVEFRGSDEGLVVSLEPASSARILRVNVGADPRLAAFRRKHARDLLAARRQILAEATRKFCLDWQRAAEANAVLDASEYLIPLGFAATVNTLGYHVEAMADDRIYPCAYEDAEGSLYFILPSETNTFRLEGRELPDGRVLFPGSYVVRVRR